MSTNATIAVQHDNGSFSQIYVHWDGDTSYTGRILRTYYTEQELVERLVDLGNLSSVGPEIGKRHDFDMRDHDMCTAYDRDRGEEGQEPAVYLNFNEMADEGDQQQYNYVFMEGKWYWCKDSIYMDKLRDLNDVEVV